MLGCGRESIGSRWREVVLPLCCVLLFWAPQRKADMAILERTPSPLPPHCPSHFPLASECWALGANGHQRQQDRAVLARSSAGRRQALAQQRCPATTTSTPLPILAVAVRAVSLLSLRGSSCPGRDGPGQLLLRLQVGSPRGSGTRGHSRAPQQRPFSRPPRSALQGGSQRRRAGAECGRAAEPGPPEEREAPSPPPGGTGGGQVAVRASEPSCLSPLPGPGPGPRAGTPWHQPQAPGPWCWMHQCPSQGQAGDRAVPGGTPRRPPPARCPPLLSADVAPPCAHSSAWPWTSCGC